MTQNTQAEAPSEREAILRAAVAAMPHTNPLVAEDLIGGHTMHTEAEDIIAIWRAAQRAALATQQERDREDAELFRWLSNTNWYVGPEPDSDAGYCNANIGDLRGELRAARSSEGGAA